MVGLSQWPGSVDGHCNVGRRRSWMQIKLIQHAEGSQLSVLPCLTSLVTDSQRLLLFTQANIRNLTQNAICRPPQSAHPSKPEEVPELSHGLTRIITITPAAPARIEPRACVSRPGPRMRWTAVRPRAQSSNPGAATACHPKDSTAIRAGSGWDQQGPRQLALYQHPDGWAITQ